MTVETAVAAPSAAVEAPKFTQFDGWDEEGTPVVTKKADSPQGKPEGAEAAAADTSKETKAEDAADSAANKKQETRRKPDAEARIKELAARTKQLEKDLEEARKPKAPAGEKKTDAESSTARQGERKAQPQTYQEWRKEFKPADWVKEYSKNNPGTSYEDSNAAMAEHLLDVRDQYRTREQQAQQELEALGKQLDEARGRYTDFDPVTKPLIAEMLKPDIPSEVFAVINQSPVLADLLYTIGGTEASKADFLDACRTNPGKALRVALLMEQEITAELGKGKGAEKKAGEGEAAAASAATRQPRAPKPPTEVGGRGAPGEDALISAAKTGDFRSFDAEQTRRVLATRK